MENRIIKALVRDEQIRFYFIDNTQLLEEIFELNEELSPTLKILLGKTVSVMSVLTGTLKGNQRMSLQVRLSNPAYKISAEAEANGNVRGYLNEGLLTAPGIEQCPLENLVGPSGMIRVITGSEMSQFTSITDMPNRNIADDIANYFMQSDQTPTFIQADVQLDDDGNLVSSHAIYAQLLPGAPLHLLLNLKKTAENTPDIFKSLKTDDMAKSTIVLNHLFENARIIGDSFSRFFCGCSKDMFYGVLYSLSKEEIEESLKFDEAIQTFCHTCGRTYTFSQEDVQHLI